MLKPFMRPVFSALLLSSMMLSGAAFGTKEDFKQQIEMSYEYQNLDVKRKTSIITGNVHIRQGSLNIYADRVEIDATQGEGNEVFIASGERASYEQALEDGSVIKAFANTIEYQRGDRTLSLSGNAEVNQAGSQFIGDSIVFNMELEQLTAQGTDAQEGRVTTIFQPQNLRKLVDDQNDSTDEDSDKEPQP